MRHEGDIERYINLLNQREQQRDLLAHPPARPVHVLNTARASSFAMWNAMSYAEKFGRPMEQLREWLDCAEMRLDEMGAPL